MDIETNCGVTQLSAAYGRGIGAVKARAKMKK
jgi:hypothetical protein